MIRSMRPCGRLFGSLVLVLSAYGQPAAPDPAQQKAILVRIQEAALNYADRLQDFICTQFTVRSAGQSGTLTRVEIGFRQYRRYSTDSTIKFSGEESPLPNPPKR